MILIKELRRRSQNSPDAVGKRKWGIITKGAKKYQEVLSKLQRSTKSVHFKKIMSCLAHNNFSSDSDCALGKAAFTEPGLELDKSVAHSQLQLGHSFNSVAVSKSWLSVVISSLTLTIFFWPPLRVVDILSVEAKVVVVVVVVVVCNVTKKETIYTKLLITVILKVSWLALHCLSLNCLGCIV